MSNQTHTPFSFSHRNSELDFLRGIAILAVIVNHGNTDIIPTLPEVSGAFGFVVWKLRALGWSGVDLFFVLSGFLIGGTLINEIEATKDLSLKRFWAKRAFKILPSYFFLLSALTILGAVKIPPDEVYIHILFLQNYLDPATFGPTWSLAVEEHFYLFLPLALTVLINTRFGKSSSPLSYLPVLSLCVIATVWVLRIENGISGVQINDFMQSHFRADALFAGVLAHYYTRLRGDW